MLCLHTSPCFFWLQFFVVPRAKKYCLILSIVSECSLTMFQCGVVFIRKLKINTKSNSWSIYYLTDIIWHRQYVKCDTLELTCDWGRSPRESGGCKCRCLWWCGPLWSPALLLPPPAQDDPFPGLLGEHIGLWEGDEADPGLWVPRVWPARSPAAMLRHLAPLLNWSLLINNLNSWWAEVTKYCTNFKWNCLIAQYSWNSARYAE